jgi:hypothetical protein
MHKLWVFGCSHGSRDYNLLETELSWPEIVANDLGYTLSNQCKSGYSNDEIFNEILHCYQEITPNDLVLVQFTHPERVVHDGTTMMPSDPAHNYWYKTVNSDDFYYNKFIQMIAACGHLLSNTKYYISYVDPSLLIKKFTDSAVKKLAMDRAIIFPKLTLSKSFPLGIDNKHLSAAGNQKLADCWINHLNRVK